MKCKKIHVIIPILFLLFSCNSKGGSDPIPPDPQDECEYSELVIPSSYNNVSLGSYVTYYVDANNGNDHNSGLSEDLAFASIEFVNQLIQSITLETPTRILFKAGTTYNGMLDIVSFEASDDKPLLIGSYGNENNGYATFTASPYCVSISGSNVRVENLELTNISGQRGFNVYTSKADATKNIVLKHNYIHDINFDFEAGLPSKKQGQDLKPEDVDISEISPTAVTPSANYIYQNSAIYLSAATGKVIGPSWFENFWIEDNLIERVSRCGLFIDSQWVKRPGIDWGYNTYINDDNGWYPSKNINVLNNLFKYTGGDGAVVLGVRGGVMQGNTCYHAQYLGRGGYYCAGLWCHSTVDYVMQYNEVAYTHLLNGSGDGEGYDIDMSCKNVTFQYNYSHHNDGGGILLCTNGTVMTIYNDDGTVVRDDDGLPHRERRIMWGPVTIRNNVFADNGGTVFENSDALDNLTINNNTIVMPGKKSNEKLFSQGSFSNNILGKDMIFADNIIYLRNSRFIESSVLHFDVPILRNNLFWNFDNESLNCLPSTNSYSFNPGLENSEAKDGFNSVNDFVMTNRDVIGNGYLFGVMNKFDLKNNNVEGKRYLGAFAVVK